ncbi:MAG: flagellar type III secretion system pore protein FliP [Planctomycetes bacterium]|nr:flagellar type III secretion system pore protein FliP [Planctomycetota bacterium]
MHSQQNRTPPIEEKPARRLSVHYRFRRWGTTCFLLLAFASLTLRPAFLSAQTSSRKSQSGSEIQSAAANALPPSRTGALNNENDSENGLPAGLDVEEMLSPGGLSSTLKIMLLLTVLSLAPSILIMTTCFIRFVIVLGLLRQALGTQQLPPNQVIVSLCLFLTFLVMAPVWEQSYNEGIQPYTNPETPQAAPSLKEAFENTMRPLRNFMADQIEMTGNHDAVWQFLEFQNPDTESVADRIFADPDHPLYEEVPLSVLLPAYMLSELKTAFLIGFQLYLPFLIIDMVISSVLISMGMMMLPPVLISLPFKLLLFVMIDGWFLTIGMLLESVRPFG